MCILNLNGNSSVEGMESSGALLRKFKEWTVLVSSFQQRKVESGYFLSYKFENTSSKYYMSWTSSFQNFTALNSGGKQTVS